MVEGEHENGGIILHPHVRPFLPSCGYTFSIALAYGRVHTCTFFNGWCLRHWIGFSFLFLYHSGFAEQILNSYHMYGRIRL